MDYKLLFDTAVFAGELLMKNGAETYRVEDTMYRILKKSNLKTVQVLVMMTGFVATLDDPSMDSLTVVRRINSRGTDLELIDKVNVISREFCSDQIPLEVAFARMKALWREPHESKRNLAAMAALTGGFAVMFGGSAADVAVAAATGFLTAAVPGEYSRDLIIISAIMPLVPGAAITNAVFDTLHGDYLSGLARAAEAFVIAAAVALGIGIGMSLI